MKKYLFLLICACMPAFVFAQTSTTIYASGASGSYTTGSATYTPSLTAYSRGDGIIAVTSRPTSQQVGYAQFDISTIPAGATITSVELGLNVAGYSSALFGICNTYARIGALSTVTNPATLYNDCSGTGGTQIFQSTASPTSAGSYECPLIDGVGGITMTSTTGTPSSTLATIVQTNAGSTTPLSISFSVASGTTDLYNFTGETGSHTTAGGTSPAAPFLIINYTYSCTSTPTAGTVNATTLSACNTTTVSLTDVTVSTGVTYQWQSSADSLTWSTISGATASGYIFSGLTTTTYYRCFITCISSGLSSTTAGLKINYFPCCSGVPSAGTTMASTTYCNSCSLTLSLSGAASSFDIRYQWQTSPDNITWSNMAGATTTSYNLIPTRADYYRCMVNCTNSGLSAYSSGVFVGYNYNIIADSVKNAPDTICNPPQFYIKINGSSSLLSLKTYYGDGTHDSVSLISSGGSSSASPSHIYSCPGYYTIKQVICYNSIPQDSITFSYHYYLCKVFPFKFYYDLNGDCVKDNTEHFNSIPISIEIDSASIPIDIVSATTGFYYKALGSPGTIYSYSILPGNAYISCPVSGIWYDTVQSTVNNYSTKYIALGCSNTGIFDLAVSAVVPTVGERDQWGDIYVRNNSCTPTNATLTLHYSPKYSASITTHIAPSSSSLGTITWNLTGLSSDATNPVDIYFEENAPYPTSILP